MRHILVRKDIGDALGGFFMSNDMEVPLNNEAVHNIAQIIKSVISLAAEAKSGAMFINAREATLTQKTLEELRHQKPRTLAQTITQQ